MKKTLLITLIVVALLALMVGTAVADEWWLVDGMAAGFNGLAPAKQAVLLGAGLTFATDTVGADFISDMNPAGRSGLGLRSDGWGDFDPNTIAADAPHGGYSTTTNYCKSCHAVHDAGADSYRLLKNGGALALQAGEGDTNGLGTARDNECMYCHNAASGATSYRPYALGMMTTVRGEHTIGATYIPDSRISTDMAGIEPVTGGSDGHRLLADGRSAMLSNRDPKNRDAATGGVLGCYDCHSVHGANTLAVWAGENLLRLDPANDGTNVTDDGRTGYANSTDAGTYNGVVVNLADMERSNFCADCHNKNASWDRDDSRPNAVATASSHVMGPAADGLSEVYGTTQTVAKNIEKGVTDRGCRGCHNSNDQGTKLFLQTTNTVSAWPHQSLESKFLKNNTQVDSSNPDAVNGYDGEATGYDRNGQAGDAYRSLFKMDSVCLKCHSANGDGTGTWGVGISF